MVRKCREIEGEERGNEEEIEVGSRVKIREKSSREKGSRNVIERERRSERRKWERNGETDRHRLKLTEI